MEKALGKTAAEVVAEAEAEEVGRGLHIHDISPVLDRHRHRC